MVAAFAAIVAQLLVRWWVAGSGYFYWDDLILFSRAARYPLLSEDLLLFDHDGHLMPMAFGLTKVVTEVAPLRWALPVAVLLAMQAAASLAVLRMVFVLVGVRRTALIPLVFYLFAPLSLTAFAWWSAALNALPLQFALAWVIGDAVLLVRTRRVRHAISGVAVLVFALLFFEKAVLVPVVAFAVAVLVFHVGRRERPVRTVARRGAPLWIGSGIAVACWAGAYLTAVEISGAHHSVGDVRGLLPGATSYGLVPALLGGPWVWERWLPSTPWADPPRWAMVLSWAVVIAAAAWAVRARRRVVPVLILAVGYVLLAQLPVALARSGPNTAGELMQSLRYFADAAVVVAAAMAILARARPRPRTVTPGARVAVALTALFLVSCLISTVTFVRSWRVTPTEGYLNTVRAELEHWDGVPLLDQEVPWNVLNPTAYPDNLAARVLAPVAPPGLFAESTTRLRMIADSGRFVDAVVWWNRSVLPGPDPDCGYRVPGPQPASLPLDGPMLEHEWTAQINYLASGEGRMTVSLEYGRVVTVPVRPGLNTVFVRVIGSGSALRVGPVTPGLDLCVGVGPVGVASYDF
ncbi:hypothetical protein IT779_16050 [Nocardia sp. NEAU-351]|uniref:DUF2079 domain-containing protein n=1 Tax=Nocardia bovistercoris TaxID=2785916 RepID=A0A931IAJ0_9NOCA|nr:hypothetical protein [Nocardia bovistercoris]